MSSAASALRRQDAGRFSFLDSTIGKKVVMAATGAVLFGFVLGHMAGNLQVYAGPEKLDNYAKFLHNTPGLLWSARIVVALSLILHVRMAIQLAHLKARARPVAYARWTAGGSTYASRTMLWSGPILLAFLIYHILHFTLGPAHPDFREGEVYRNLVSGFRQVPAAIAYIIAMAMLCQHLYHGVWSMFQTLGVNHPRYTPLLKRAAAMFAAIIAIGNISIPVSVLAGWIR